MCVEQTNNYYAPEAQTTVYGKNTSLDGVCFSSFTYTDMFHSWVPSAEFTLLIDERGTILSHFVKIPVTYVFTVLLNIIKGIINYVYMFCNK